MPYVLSRRAVAANAKPLTDINRPRRSRIWRSGKGRRQGDIARLFCSNAQRNYKGR